MKDRPDAIQLQSGSAPLELKDGIFLSHTGVYKILKNHAAAL